MPVDVTQTVGRFFQAYPLHHDAKGTQLIHPEEPLVDIFYLTQGTVVCYDIAPNGNEVVVNAFKPGAFFPLSLALTDNNNPYFFEAASPITFHRAPAHDVVTFLHEHPDVTFDVLQRVYRGVDGVLRRMAHLMGGTARTRLTYELVNAAQRFGTPHARGTFVPLTESDLAKRTGLARETISRTLRTLKSSGSITVQARGIIVHNSDELAHQLGESL